MKRNNKGFVFIETILVITFLAVSLIVVYKTFTNVLTNEKRRLYYDDPIYLYRTYYILDYLESNNITSYIEKKLNEPNSDNSERLLFEFTCSDQALFQRGTPEAKFCENIVNSGILNVEHIYFTYYDTSAINECTNTSSGAVTLDDFKCKSHESLRSLSSNALSYIRTLGGIAKNENGNVVGTLDGYRIIVEYKIQKDVANEDSKGDTTMTKRNDYYYASLLVPYGE